MNTKIRHIAIQFSTNCFFLNFYTLGETIVSEAQKVLMYSPLSDKKRSITGILTVTTFKLSFASAVDPDSSNYFQQNLILGINDVCLSSIDHIYQITDRSKKKLTPGQNVNGKIKDVLIVCKVKVLFFQLIMQVIKYLIFFRI